jgi:hypothetical protein
MPQRTGHPHQGAPVLLPTPSSPPRMRPSASIRPILARALRVLLLAGLLPSALPLVPGERGDVRPLAAQGITRDQVIWTAGALQRVLGERDYPMVLALAALNRLTEGGGVLPEGTAPLLTVLAQASTGAGPLARCKGLRDPVEGTLCSLEALTPLLPPELGRPLTEEGTRLIALYFRPGELPPPGVAARPGAPDWGGEGVLLAPLQAFTEQALADAWRLRERLLLGGVQAGEHFASVVSTVVGLTPGVAADLLLAQLPDIRGLVRAHPTLAMLEGAVREGEAVLLDYRDFLGSVSVSARGLLSQAQGVDTQVRGLGDWARQRSFAYLSGKAAQLAGVEADVAGRVQTLGNAAADIQREGTAFAFNLLRMGEQAAMTALTGNVFTVAAGVAAFFQLAPGALGPGAVQDVRVLRSVVDSLRTGMEAEFAQVGGRLDELFTTLDSRFGRLETLVASNHAAVREDLFSLQLGLTALGQRIDRLESNLVTYLEAGFDRDFSRTLIRCLEHRERHLPPFDEIDQATYSACLADFRARGARDARDALLTDRTTPVDDRSLAAALADSSEANLARRLPLLARAAEQRFDHRAMGGGRGGANPLEWGVASEAYLSMLREWPEQARSVAPADLSALLSTGEEIRGILDGILIDEPAPPLPARVLTYYQTRLSELTRESGILAQRYQQAQLRRVDPDSVLTRVEPIPEATVPERPLPTLAVPAPVAAAIPRELRTTAVLALDEPVLRYRAVVEDSVAHGNFRRSRVLFRPRHDRMTWARTRVEIELRSRDRGLLARYALTGPAVLRRIEEMGGSVEAGQVRAVREVVPDPVEHFLREVWPGLATEGEWEVGAPSAGLVRSLEEGIAAELRNFESASLNRTFSAVCQEGGGGGALSGPDRESALRIQTALEGMTAARVLLRSYLKLATPEALQRDALMRDLLEGESGLLDRGELCRVVASGASPLRVVWLEDEPQREAGLVEQRLADVASRSRPGGALSPMEATLAQLRAALRIQEIRTRIARAGGVPGVPVAR